MIGAVIFERGVLKSLAIEHAQTLCGLLGKIRDHCIASAPDDERINLMSNSERLVSPKKDLIGKLLSDIHWVDEATIATHGAAWRITKNEAQMYETTASPIWDAAVDDGFVIHDNPEKLLFPGPAASFPLIQPLQRALHGQTHLSIFDPYLARKIYENEAPAIATLGLFADLLRTADAESPSITINSFWEPGSQTYPVFHAMRMRNMLESLATSLRTNFRVSVREQMKIDGTRKWHGRYLVLSGKWVIQSDTGCDFVIPDARGLSRMQPNEFFRWDVSQFRPEKLQNRFDTFPELHPSINVQPLLRSA